MSTYQHVDERRKETFLAVLAETGSMAAAAAAATPHGYGPRQGYATFYQLIKRDPEFAAAVEEAKNAALGHVEAEIRRRAFTPTKRPVFSKGELVGEFEDHRDANQLLLRLAERLDPSSWAQNKKVQVDGKIAHTHTAVASLTLEHLDLLDEGERNLLIDLLDKIATRQRQGVKQIASQVVDGR